MPELSWQLDVSRSPVRPADLVTYACIQYRNPQSRGPCAWEFRRAGEVVPVAVASALTVTDVGTMLGACLAGAGIAQVMALGCEELLRRGEFVELFPNWPGETIPLQACYPSRRHLPPRVRALVELCRDISAIPH